MTPEERFSIAVETVLRHEGGLVDDPEDPGDITRWGISLRLLRSLEGIVGDIDGDGVVDPDDVRKLPRGEAVAIYRREWWDRYQYDRIRHLPTATKVFDLAVNMGSRRAHRLLQRSLHACRRRDVTVDGLIGPQTIAAVNDVKPPAMVLSALRAEAAGFYRSLVQANSERRKWLNGWLNRAYD